MGLPNPMNDEAFDNWCPPGLGAIGSVSFPRPLRRSAIE